MAMEKLAEMDVLREFAKSALGMTKHHAPGSEHLVLALTGAVAAYHDAGTAKPGTREGHHLTSCWFDLKGVTYFVSYHDQIMRIRRHGKQGEIDFAFTEGTTDQDVFRWFESKDPVPEIR